MVLVAGDSGVTLGLASRLPPIVAGRAPSHAKTVREHLCVLFSSHCCLYRNPSLK
jgi:hypothetical protein